MSNIGFYSQENFSFKLNGPNHTNEDKPIFFKLNDEITGKPAYVLGILDGHDGDIVVQYAYSRLMDFFKDESWIRNIQTDKDVCEFLAKVIVTIDKDFLEGLQANEQPLQNEEHSLIETHDNEHLMRMVSSSERHEENKSCGCALVIGLILRDKLYVANVGDCHAVLCQTDPVTQQRFCTSLTVEHTLQNDSEVQRLHKCGLSTEAIRMMGDRSKYSFTRCLGDYRLKCQYQDFPYLRQAKSQPVVAVPQITGGLTIEGSWRHLIFVSSGVCRLLLELVFDRDKVDGELGHSLYKAHENLSAKGIVTLNDVVRCVIEDLSNKCESGYRYLNEAVADENEFIGHGDLSIMVYQFPYLPVMRPPSPLFDTNDNCHIMSGLSLDNIQASNVNFDLSVDNRSLENPSICITEPPPIDLSPEVESSNTQSTTNNSNEDSTKTQAYVNFEEWQNHFNNLPSEVLEKLEAIMLRWPEQPDVDTIPEEDCTPQVQSRRTSAGQTGEVSFHDLSNSSIKGTNANDASEGANLCDQEPSYPSPEPVLSCTPAAAPDLDLMSLPSN